MPINWRTNENAPSFFDGDHHMDKPPQQSDPRLDPEVLIAEVVPTRFPAGARPPLPPNKNFSPQNNEVPIEAEQVGVTNRRIDATQPIEPAFEMDQGLPDYAELIPSGDLQVDDASPPPRTPTVEVSPSESVITRSWVFRLGDGLSTFCAHIFGIASVIMILAVTASIPLVQLISLGYLLEVSGRLARGLKLRDAMVGLRKATVVGGVVVGSWICLLPIRLISGFWFDAYLIDPASSQTNFLRFLQIAVIGLTLAHIAAALICGGKLRYFFWPLIAPLSFGIWTLRRLAGIPVFRKTLDMTLGWISPSLSNDVCHAQPISDFFLPAIVWRRVREGKLYVCLRNDLWDFCAGLRPVYYFVLGAKGFAGTLLWLLVPTGLLVTSSFTEGGVALSTFLLGVAFAIPIFAGLPFIQAHFARDGRFVRFLQPWQVFKNFGRAPIAHLIALLMVLILALPLFLLKIEAIPSELLWTLSLVFVTFNWPAKVAVGLAYRRGAKKEKPSPWWLRYPIVLSTAPISFAFVIIFTGTKYVTWHGTMSLFENHVFLLQAPFWL